MEGCKVIVIMMGCTKALVGARPFWGDKLILKSANRDNYVPAIHKGQSIIR